MEYSSRRYIEDTPTLVQILYWARRVITIDYAGYFYVQNSTSLTHTASVLKNDIYRALCIKDINTFFEDKNKDVINYDEFFVLLNKIKNSSKAIDFEEEIRELYEYEKHING